MSQDHTDRLAHLIVDRSVLYEGHRCWRAVRRAIVVQILAGDQPIEPDRAA